ncbi:MAG: glycosyltransferase family 4 protein [Phototrophicaceae bacterium]
MVVKNASEYEPMDALKRRFHNIDLSAPMITASSYLRGLLGQKTIYRVHDESSWALYWVAYYIGLGLKQLNVPTQQTNIYRPLRNQIIHFDSRYAYLLKPEAYLHPSNHAFLTWFHGDPADEDFKAIYNILSERQSQIDGVVVSTKTGLNNLKLQGFPPEKLSIIPIGVDTKKFKPASIDFRQVLREQLGIQEDEFCIGSFQKDGDGWEDGLEPKLIKGPDIFLDVIAEVKKSHHRLVVLLLGPARGYVKAGLDKIGVRYIHRLVDDYHDVAQYYHALDLYLITSRDEGGPKGFMESWASGIPVVSTRMGMPADYIQHGINGYLANVEDVNSLAEAILTVINAKDVRQSIVSQALIDVQPLDWMAVAKQYYEKLYQPILSPEHTA